MNEAPGRTPGGRRPDRPRATKIVATLGPAVERPGHLVKLLRAGADVVRLNGAHCRRGDIRRRTALVRRAERVVGRPVGTLEVNQEVSVPSASSGVAGANPDIAQRTATTTVVVASGESIVLGGLIREDNNRTTAGIPLLSKIPVIGAAFGTQNIVKRRTETILLIRPVVITSTAQAAEATGELKRRMQSLEALLPPRPAAPLPPPAKP